MTPFHPPWGPRQCIQTSFRDEFFLPDPFMVPRYVERTNLHQANAVVRCPRTNQNENQPCVLPYPATIRNLNSREICHIPHPLHSFPHLDPQRVILWDHLVFQKVYLTIRPSFVHRSTHSQIFPSTRLHRYYISHCQWQASRPSR